MKGGEGERAAEHTESGATDVHIARKRSSSREKLKMGLFILNRRWHYPYSWLGPDFSRWVAMMPGHKRRNASECKEI